MGKYKNCEDVTDEQCYVGGHNCGNCMYCDNMRFKNGFVMSQVDSGVPCWCTAAKKESADN